MYPLLMAPYFRHGSETPWGGSMLRDVFLKDAPDDQTGESLEVSALEGRESLVLNGPQAGRTLGSMIRLWGKDLTGEIEGTFPLLIKLLDARELCERAGASGRRLRRASDEGKLGKTEAWVVLNCERRGEARPTALTRRQGRTERSVARAGRVERGAQLG